jgi:hypothetical protein
VKISVQIHWPLRFSAIPSRFIGLYGSARRGWTWTMMLTVETIVRPDEVVPVPPLEVILGPPELHQRLSHGGGEPEPRAPAECTVHRLKHEEFRQAKDSKNSVGGTRARRRRIQWTCKAKKEECQPSEQASIHGQQRKEPSMDWSSRVRGRGRSIRGIKNDGSSCRWCFLVLLLPTWEWGTPGPSRSPLSSRIHRCGAVAAVSTRRPWPPPSPWPSPSCVVPLPLSVSPTDSLALWRSFCCARWCRVWVWETDRSKRGIDCFYRQGGSGKKQSRAAEQGMWMWGGKSSLGRSNRCDETWLVSFWGFPPCGLACVSPLVVGPAPATSSLDCCPANVVTFEDLCNVAAILLGIKTSKPSIRIAMIIRGICGRHCATALLSNVFWPWLRRHCLGYKGG